MSQGRMALLVRPARPLRDGGAARLPALPSRDLRFLPAHADGEERRAGRGAAARRGVPHVPSGFRYRLRGIRCPFESGSLRGNKALSYFVGLGRRGAELPDRADGFLFQAPVAYYARESKWELSPGYSAAMAIRISRGRFMPGCLTCHASYLKPVEGTQNRYGSPAFEEGGVACERCHGDVESHDAIVNPAKLAPDRRDSVCAQCHLSGEARVQRAGTDWGSVPAGRAAVRFRR